MFNNHSKSETVLPNFRAIHLKDTDEIANSADSDQTAPLGAV